MINFLSWGHYLLAKVHHSVTVPRHLRLLIGPGWMVVWNLVFSAQMLVNRGLKTWISTDLLVWVRCLIVLVSILLVIRPKRLGQSLSLQLGRGLCVTATLACSYHAYRTLPTYAAALLGSTGPLFSVFLANLLLKERIRPAQWACTAIGFLGVALVYYPWQNLTLGTNELIALMGNVTAALTSLCGRVLASRQVPVPNTMFFGSAIPFATYSLILMLKANSSTPLMTVSPTHPMTAWAWVGVLSLGFLAMGSQTAYLRALAHAPVAVITPLEYFRLVIMIPLAYVFFGDVPPRMFYVGSCLSVGACLVLTRLTLGGAMRKP